MKREVILILDNIRSVHNVGSIFRTADAAGVGMIYLCGVSPAPLDRFGRKRSDLAKVALGAEESVSWQQFPDTAGAIKKAKEDGFEIVAVEQAADSVSLKDFEIKAKTALVFGSETIGMTAHDLALCDKIIELPMLGKKESLNVAVTAGIVLYHLLLK